MKNEVMRRGRGIGATVAFAVLVSGGATAAEVTKGTIMLREVVHVMSRDEILSGNVGITRDNRGREPVRWPELHSSLLKDGMTDADMTNGAVIIGRTQYFWHNTTSGIVRQYLRVSPVSKGLRVDVGNVVEVALIGELETIVVGVKYKNLAEGGCDYRVGDRGVVGRALNEINPIGGAGAASLFCPALAGEGWVPIRHIRGIEWTKEKK